MINTKQRAYLRSLANDLTAQYQLGKNGITQEFLAQIEEALVAKELIKINVLKNSSETPKDTMIKLCNLLKCEAVSVVGCKVVLYRKSKDKDKIKIII